VALSAGSRLGPYEVTALLGEGGMGKVWRAHHAGLKRDDALKVLPDAFAADPDRLARFRQEAQILASLNHPNIAHVYGFEQSDGVQALVMELVEGPTLADRIVQGPIPVDEALPIAGQIAEALEAAHESGIIHRDLKPANIKLRDDGTVKVLDFGLAKALEPAAATVQPAATVLNAPTKTSPAMTQVGVILGTAAYMSREQAKGRAADKRSDLWAFGCVLYEMLTGRAAFAGDDVADTLAFVLTKSPHWGALPANTPTRIVTLLRRGLEKDWRRRLADAVSVRLDIDDALAEPQLAHATAASTLPSPRTLALAAGAFTLGVAISAGAAWIWRPVSPAPVFRSEMRLPADRGSAVARRRERSVHSLASRL